MANEGSKEWQLLVCWGHMSVLSGEQSCAQSAAAAGHSCWYFDKPLINNKRLTES